MEPATELQDLRTRLTQYTSGAGLGVPEFIAFGGSAALFRVDSSTGPRAIKVMKPTLFEGARGDAERHRVELQQKLIGHDCPNLVSITHIEQAHGTIFMEMPMLDWEPMNRLAGKIPVSSLPSLLSDLLSAVRYLTSRGLVHRDIKPENILVSPQFDHLILVDLGVLREITAVEDPAGVATDHGDHRPFLATAQYSSPEYLFRYEPPSPELWLGLNFYQIGAFLHDLITGRPLFSSAINTGNRWTIAKAVLTELPALGPLHPDSTIKYYQLLANRCLTKSLPDRLSLVKWEDFLPPDPLAPKLATLLRGAQHRRTENERAARWRERRREMFTTLAAELRRHLTEDSDGALSIELKIEDSNIVLDTHIDLDSSIEFNIATKALDSESEMLYLSHRTRTSGTTGPFTGEQPICEISELQPRGDTVHLLVAKISSQIGALCAQAEIQDASEGAKSA